MNANQHGFMRKGHVKQILFHSFEVIMCLDDKDISIILIYLDFCTKALL